MEKKVVAFVPIKLNSQRLAKKNILPLGDKPLCYYIFESLLSVKDIDEVYVYCSDENVKEYVPNEVKFLKRDPYLDGDLVKGKEIYSSFIKDVDSDIYILAHTTSPFIKSTSISQALKKVQYEGYDSALTIQKHQTFAWYMRNPLNYELNDIPRTQDIEPVYIETSGFFIFEKKIFCDFERRIGFNPYLQEVNHLEAIDIDTEEDYLFAKKLV